MSLDSYSKHGVLIGSFYLIVSLTYTIGPLTRIIRNLEIYEEYDYISGQILQNSLTMLLSLIMAIFSILLIAGIVKKRHLFMTPWLIFSTVGLIFTIASLVFQLFAEYDHIFMILSYDVYFMGTQIVVIYPMYILFCNIRENSKKTLPESNESFNNKEKKLNADFLTSKFQV